MIILLYVEPGLFIHTNNDEFINSKKELKSFEFLFSGPHEEPSTTILFFMPNPHENSQQL